jgi:hypothetical protein
LKLIGGSWKTKLKEDGKEICRKSIHSWSEEREENSQERWSDELKIQLLEKYEEIHGTNTYTSETLEKMENSEIASIMKGIRQKIYGYWVIERIIQNSHNYNLVIMEKVDIARMIIKKLETKERKRSKYLETKSIQINLMKKIIHTD